jgi:hypothetical protein
MKRASQWSRVSGKFDISRDPSASSAVSPGITAFGPLNQHTHSTESGVGRRRRAPRWEIQFNAIRKSVRLFIITVRGRMSGGRAHTGAAARQFSLLLCGCKSAHSANIVLLNRNIKRTDGRTNGESEREFSRIIGRGGQNFASTPARECCGWMAYSGE